MTTRAFQKIYTKIDNITKATVTLKASGVGNDELATVGGKLAQVVKIMGENVTLQVFAGTEGIATDSEVISTASPRSSASRTTSPAASSTPTVNRSRAASSWRARRAKSAARRSTPSSVSSLRSSSPRVSLA